MLVSRVTAHDLLCKHEWDHVSYMHVITGPSSRVQKERFLLFVSIKNLVEFSNGHMLDYHRNSKQRHRPMTKKHSTSEKNVRSVASQSLESLQNLGIKPASAELDYELVVINCILFSI
jgi:hypothetical protein